MKITKKLILTIMSLISIVIIIAVIVYTGKDISISFTDTKTVYHDKTESCFYYDTEGVHKIFSDNTDSLIYPAKNCFSIYVDENNLYVINYNEDDINPCISKLDFEGNVLISEQVDITPHLSDNITDYKNYISIIGIADKYMICSDNYDGYAYIFDTQKNFNECEIEFERIIEYDNIKCGYIGNCRVIFNDDFNGKMTVDMLIFGKNGTIYQSSPTLNKCCFNGTVYSWDSTHLSDLSTFSIDTGKSQMYDEFFKNTESYVNQLVQYSISDNVLTMITRNTSIESRYSENIKNHNFDTVCLVDLNDLKICKELKTKKYERILYADTEKTITYYKGNYCTYSMSDWELLEKQSAHEIKNGGSYSFEVCGDLLFVFDEESSKLLNTIDVS